MPQVDTDKIKMKTLTGGKDKVDLTDCYFYPTGTSTPQQYNFYQKAPGDDGLLAGPFASGGSFSFQLDNFTWTIPDPAQPTNPLVITGSGSTATATGSWHNSDPTASIEDQSSGESGTFTAQAGGSPEVEDASAAKA